MAENRYSQISLLLTALLFITAIVSVASGQTIAAGVYLSLNGMAIPNDGYVIASDIGEDDNGLYCNTDRSDCCGREDHPNGTIVQGEWYYPNGSQVQSFTYEVALDPTRSFFYRNRFTQAVRLNRDTGNPQERGRFRCEVPNADGDNVTMYVNIVDVLPTVTASSPTEPPIVTTSEIITTPPTPVSVTVSPIISSGTATAGESYSLECTVTVTGSNDQPMITWLMGPMDNMITSGVVTTGSMSTLTFNPLSASHAGTYTCRATLGSAVDTASRTITVQTTSITVQITSSVATPALEQSYSLSCEVTRANGTISAYQWMKDGTEVSTGPTVAFSPLTLSDAGQYTCQVTVDGMMHSRTEDIRLTIPSTASVSVISTPSSPVHVTSTVTVTCTVELNSAIMESDLSLLMVSAQLTHPNGTMLSLQSDSMRGTTFTYTTQLNSFRRSDFGSYICVATIGALSSSTYLSGSGSGTSTVEITTILGVYLILGGQLYRNGDSILIDEIGEGDDGALLCVTDLVQCCHGKNTGGRGALGEWFYPNGSVVRVNGSNDDIYRNRGLGIVRLNRRNNAMSPTGQFCCMVPDATFTNKTTCINIVMSISESSTQLPSEPVTATVILASSPPFPSPREPGDKATVIPESSCTCTCTSDVGIAVGGLILVEGILATVAAIVITVICWRRKSGKSTSDFAVSANMAYDDVKLGGSLGDAGGEYEDPDKLARSGQGGGGGGGNYETIGCPAPYEFPDSKPEAPVYATADDRYQ